MNKYGDIGNIFESSYTAVIKDELLKDIVYRAYFNGAMSAVLLEESEYTQGDLEVYATHYADDVVKKVGEYKK
jgi:hypothetical protein